MNLISQDYLMHHGVKGMKWGVRRYQNADGSLTSAGQRRLYKKVKRAKSDNKRRELIRQHLNSEYANDRNKALQDFRNQVKKTADYDVKMDIEVDKLADKMAKPIYEKELKKWKESIGEPSEKDKDKLYEAIKYDNVYWKAEKQIKDKNPQYRNNEKQQDALWKEYTKKNKKVVDSIVGKYGEKKVTDSDIWTGSRNEYQYVVEDLLDDDLRKSK